MTRVSRQKGVKFEQRPVLPNLHGTREFAPIVRAPKSKRPRFCRGLSCSALRRFQSSDQRHQLKRQTSDEVTVWTNFSDWIKSPVATPKSKSWMSFLL